MASDHHHHRPSGPRAPSEFQESDEERHARLNRELEEDHRFGGTHWLPLFLALIPSFGSLFHGDSETWTDALLLLLVAFFLYKSTRIPWQLYASARTTRIRSSIQLANDPGSPNVIHALPDLQGHTTELERIELFSLLLAIASPSIGVFFLFVVRTRLNLDLEYLNSNATILFILASLIKPLTHLHGLLLARATYLQTKLHFPEDLLTELRITASELNTRLTKLETAAVSKYELKLLKQNYLDQPILKISETLSQQIQADEKRQRQVTEESAELARALVKIESRIAATASNLDALVEERSRIGESPMQTLAQMVIQLIWDTEHHKTMNKKKKSSTNTSAAYVERLPSDTDSDEDGSRPQFVQRRDGGRTGAVEFIPRRKKDSTIPERNGWTKMVLWPISVPLRVYQGIWDTMYTWIWTPETQAEFERLSQLNYQKDRAAIPGHQRPVWPGWFPPGANGHVNGEKSEWGKGGGNVEGEGDDELHDTKGVEEEDL